MKTKHTHTYAPMTPEMRPQDPFLDGRGLKFETLEHGGDEPDTMPQAVKMTDAKGNWCVYLPTAVGGKVVQSYGFNSEPTES